MGRHATWPREEAAASARSGQLRLSHLDGESKAGTLQDRRKAGKLGVALAGEHAVHALTVQVGFLGKAGHAFGFGDVAKGHQENLLRTLFERSVEIRRRLFGVREVFDESLLVTG